MSELKLTPARRALLQAIDDGAVTKHFGIFPARDWIDWDRGPGWKGTGRRYKTVTKPAHLLWCEGWVELVEPPVGAPYKFSRKFRLTDAGRAVLDGAK